MSNTNGYNRNLSKSIEPSIVIGNEASGSEAEGVYKKYMTDADSIRTTTLPIDKTAVQLFCPLLLAAPVERRGRKPLSQRRRLYLRFSLWLLMLSPMAWGAAAVSLAPLPSTAVSTQSSAPAEEITQATTPVASTTTRSVTGTASNPVPVTTISQNITSLVLPINAVHEPKIALSLTVPTQFQTLVNSQKIPGFAMLEFIPLNETGDNWTQIITTNSFINKKVNASTLIEYMQQRFQQAATQVTVLNSSLDNYPDYQRSCTTMDYHTNQRHEMVAMCYYSGPYDTAGVQYAIRYPADNPPVDVVAKQLAAFLQAHTEVLNQEKPLGT